MSQQSLRQASYRAIHGGAGGSYNEDAIAAMQTELALYSLPVPAHFNGRLIAWLQLRLTSTDSDLPGLMTAFAANLGAHNWASIGAFDPLPGPE